MTKPAGEPLDVSVFMPVLVSDWLTGTATFPMSNRQRGAFFQMLAHSWKQQASLPDDLPALAKYADEPVEWFATPEGARVLEQWPVDPADGRRRNPKQVRVYAFALERRAAAHGRAIAGANARWGKTPPAEGPNFSDAIAGFPAVVAFAAAAPSNTATLNRALLRIVEAVGESSLIGFVGVINGALEGIEVPALTSASLERALADWCDNAAAVNKKLFRAYLAGDGAKPGTGRPRRESATAIAGRSSVHKWDA